MKPETGTRKRPMLVIGRRKPVRGDRFGGVVVAVEDFLSHLDRASIPFRVIDLNHQNYAFRIWYVLSAWSAIKLHILTGPCRVISFQGTNTDLVWFAPLAVLMSRIRRKRITVRKIGGDFDQFYNALPVFKKALVRYAITRADMFFLETRFLTNKFYWTGHTEWFPNMRSNPATAAPSREFSKRFVFISRVTRSKGVDEILKATRMLPDDYTVHIYGPDFDYIPPEDLKGVFRTCYKRPLEPDEVGQTLSGYDVLLLPTWYPGEGYPGIILEAYSRGLPVISTRWRAIPEIIREGETGFLVEPHSAEELAGAMKRMTGENHERLSRQAAEFFTRFDTDRLLPDIIDRMYNTAGAGAPARGVPDRPHSGPDGSS